MWKFLVRVEWFSLVIVLVSLMFVGLLLMMVKVSSVLCCLGLVLFLVFLKVCRMCCWIFVVCDSVLSFGVCVFYLLWLK